MLMKTIQQYVQEFPKLGLGEPGTRGTRLITWKIHVAQLLLPCGPTVDQWWTWCVSKAERAYTVFIDASIYDRAAIVPEDQMPTEWKQLDSLLRPKLLEASPAHVKEMIAARASQNIIDPSHMVLFCIMKLFAPGSADEKAQLMASLQNPHVCTNARAAMTELLRWKAGAKRIHQLGLIAPDISQTYPAMVSIFGEVFDRAEPQLNLKWVQLKNVLGLPHKVDLNTMEQIARFAEVEPMHCHLWADQRDKTPAYHVQTIRKLEINS